MSAKDTLVAALQEEGLGLTDACEHIQRVLDDLTPHPTGRGRITQKPDRSFFARWDRFSTAINNKEKPMKVNPRDGKCRECGGELEIVDADDATLSVSCLSCCSEYQVETDAFGDGCMTYYVGFMQQRMEGAPDDA